MTEALELDSSLTDGALARAAADGDRDAFAEIYDRYADRLYDFCVGLIGDRDAAADCVQDAFCAAATDLGGLRDPDKLRPWLYSIARHHAMRRLRHRYREEVSDELPDMASHEASPETLAGQSELARLVADAAGGLSDRDRELLDLSYRHGLDGPELAETLGVTLTSANTMMFRLRQTVERCLGALLVARGVQSDPAACPGLATILKGWDGQFTVLMRKRMARHIDSCDSCEQNQRRHVNPVALLGGAPVFIPAPEWLRRQTLDRVQLTSACSSMTKTPGDPNGSRRIGKLRVAVAVGIPLLCLGSAIPWFARSADPVLKVIDTGADSSDGPGPVTPAAGSTAPASGRAQSARPVGAARQPAPVQQVETTAEGSAPGKTRVVEAPAPPLAPAPVLADPGPTDIPPSPQTDSAVVPNSDPQGPAPVAQADSGPVGAGPVVTGPPVTGSVDTGPVDTGPVDSGPGVTAPVPNPKGTNATSPGSISIIPNLDPKVASSYPQNTAIITNPNATSPNLQIGTAPKPNTNTNTNTKVDTKTDTSSTNAKTDTGNTNAKTGTSNSKTGTGTDSKAAKSTSN